MSKCKPDYKNLNRIQSFSEQSYATVQWARQVCQNDEWLRQQVEQLKYLTPPAIRKRYPIANFFDKSKSYGCRSNGSEINFNDYPEEPIIVDFTDTSLIDVAKSDVEIITEDGDDGEQKSYCRLSNHPETTPEVIKSFGTSKGGGCNSFWHVGYNHSKEYKLRAEWLKNWKRSDIPSVCRAQTFKAEYSGALKSVDLKLDYNGSKNYHCASPLYVQIWKTFKKFIPKTTWDKKKKKMVYNYIKYSSIANTEPYDNLNVDKFTQYQRKLKYTSGKNKGKYKRDKNGNILTETAYKLDNQNGTYVRKREWVQWLGHNKKNPDGGYYESIKFPLAQAIYDGVGDPWPNIKFDKPCTIKKDETYAIVVFSPLSDWRHCPRWGGWGRNCKRDSVYADGHAFMSEDNGRTWKRYGKNGIDTNARGEPIEYKKGKYTPQDFAFQVNVETESAKSTFVYNDDEEYLWLSPILANPIKSMNISYESYGSESSADNHVHVEYQISTDGDYWKTIDNLEEVYFAEEDEMDSYPTLLLVRAKLWRDTNIIDDEDQYGGYTPIVENIRVNLTTVPAKEMYARTAFHIPRLEPMLGANIWGRIFAPFSNDATVDCSMEIIQSETVTDHFDFVGISNVSEKISNLGLNYPDVANYSDEDLAIYLTKHPEILTELKNRYIYVKPKEYGNKLYLLSFAASWSNSDMIVTRENEDDMFASYDVGGLSFSNEVAYPILKVRLQSPEHDDDVNGVDAFKEWVDFTFDYERNELFFKPSTLDDIVEGDLYITYNPVFLSGLTPSEVGVHVDEDTGLETEGLILDYFKEKILINAGHIESRRVKLRAKPTDPIRQVYLYNSNFGEDDEPIELYEDKHFTLDIETNELVFPPDDSVGSSIILSPGDILEVVYTPCLEDSQIALGYFAKRSDTNMQVHIKDVYFEVKA